MNDKLTSYPAQREAFEEWFIKLGLTSDDPFALTSAIKAFSFIAWQAAQQRSEAIIRELVEVAGAILTDCTFEKRLGVMRNVNEYRPAAIEAINRANQLLQGEV